MTHADFKQFSALIQGVAECYGQSLSAQGIVLRFKLVEQFDYAEVEKAALSIMATRKYTSMATPADFLEHISGGSAEDKAEVEAGKVLDAGKCTLALTEGPENMRGGIRAVSGLLEAMTEEENHVQ